jgi:hypothetical protein
VDPGAGSGDPSYGNMLVQPNYNFPDGAYVTTGPQMKFKFPK